MSHPHRRKKKSFFPTLVFIVIIIAAMIYSERSQKQSKSASAKASTSKPMVTINPATGEELHSYKPITLQQAQKQITIMCKVQKQWETTSFAHRAKCLYKVASLLRKRKKRYATMITQSMGKPITQSYAEIEKCAKLCEYYAKHAEKFLAPRKLKVKNKVAWQHYEPKGIIFAIMPWNFPFWQVFRFAVPNLMGGNGALLKHASNVMNIAQAIEELFFDAGCPAGLFQSLIMGSDLVADVIANPLVQGVTITGSEKAGALVAAQAGKYIKPTVLELGGSDPYIVCADADIDLAVEKIATSRLANNGQVCIAAKRIIVHDEIKEKFIHKLKDHVEKNYPCGDPMKKGTTLGPLVREKDRTFLQEQVDRTVKAGAKCILGGKKSEREGFYYPPTILVDIPEGAPPYKEEFFGPVFSIFVVESDDEAIALANATPFGLGAAIFTKHIDSGNALAKELNCGTCYINDMVVSTPSLPFGGWKQSGYGTELGKEGLLSFMHIKIIVSPEEPKK